jgi:hypothetical protein
MSTTHSRSATRSRWAAIGAAIAVTLGAGGIGITHATSDSGDGPVSAFFPIEPCRLADTRPAPDTVGPRSAGIGPAETYDIDGWGTVGNCELPEDTTGLSLNVTAVGATEQTNLRLFPTGADVPTAANLNPTPGAPPTPNAVNVDLNDTDGQFSVYNAFGVVAVVIDVVGYYDDHTHDSQYSNGVAYAEDDVAVTFEVSVPQDVLTMSIVAPVDGYLIVDAMANLVSGAEVDFGCSISIDTEIGGHGVTVPDGVSEWNDTQGFAVTAGAHDVTLACQQNNGLDDDVTLQIRRMTGVFSVNNLAPADS